MRNSNFTDSQIVAILREAEGDSKVDEVCRKHATPPTFYRWKKSFGAGGVQIADVRRLKELEKLQRGAAAQRNRRPNAK